MFAMCLAAPSFLFYDWLIYAIALLLLLKARPRWPLGLQAAGGLLWAAPVLHDIIDKYDETTAFYFSGLLLFLGFFVLMLAYASFRNVPSPSAAVLSGQAEPMASPSQARTC